MKYGKFLHQQWVSKQTEKQSKKYKTDTYYSKKEVDEHMNKMFQTYCVSVVAMSIVFFFLGMFVQYYI